jgi:hypothetical protein
MTTVTARTHRRRTEINQCTRKPEHKPAAGAAAGPAMAIAGIRYLRTKGARLAIADSGLSAYGVGN